MPLYDVDGRGTIWAGTPQEAFTLAHGAANDVKVEQADAHTWRMEAGGKHYNVVLRTDSK